MKNMDTSADKILFAIDYASAGLKGYKNYEGWAEKYGVNKNKIWEWMSDPEVLAKIKEINELKISQAQQKLTDSVDICIEELTKIAMKEEYDETKRKAINDIIGYNKLESSTNSINVTLNNGNIDDILEKYRGLDGIDLENEEEKKDGK